MTQYCIEEASLLALEAQQAAAVEEERAKNAPPEPEVKPGEITDPTMAMAMAEAKRLHAERYGVQV